MERNNHKVEAKDTRMCSCCSFLLKRSTSTLERCGGIESINATMLTLFFGEQATEAGSIPLSGGLEGDERNPYTEIGK
jgi:hypothetical protein